MTRPTTPALPPKAGLRFITILTLVALAHVLVIILLLAHFGWLNGVGLDTDENVGQSGIVIPVTLETGGDEENKPEEKVETTVASPSESTQESATQSQAASTPELAPAQEAPPEPAQEKVSEQTQEQTPTLPEASSSTERVAETSVQTTTEVEKEIPLAIEPEATPAVTPPAAPPAPPTLTEPAPVSPPSTSPQTTAPVLQKSATREAVKSGSIGSSSHTKLTPSANDSLPTTPAQVDPNYLHRPNPVYPAVSKRLREAGTVLLRVSLDAKGEVSDIDIQTTSAYQRLDQAAMEAVRQWRFVPATRGQQAIASTVLVPIEFKHQ